MFASLVFASTHFNTSDPPRCNRRSIFSTRAPRRLANHYGSLDAAIHDLLCPAAKDNSIRTRPRRQATLTQPLQCDRHRQRTIQTELQSTIELRARTSAKRLMNYQFHCDLQRLSCKTQKNYAQKRRQNDAWIISSNKIFRDRVTNHKRTARENVNKTTR